MPPTRRDLIVGLAACCALPGAAVAGPAQGSITLGWRWVTGQIHRYRTLIRRASSDRTETRVEEWTYVVDEVDPHGSARLIGRLTGFGAATNAHGQLKDPDRDTALRTSEIERTDREVHVGLDMTGRLVSCSARPFDLSLPHVALALSFPRDPIPVHSPWRETELLRSFADLYDPSIELELDGWATLTRLHPFPFRPRAHLETRGTAIPPGGPPLALNGDAVWDPHRGLLLHRHVGARLRTASTDDTDPGTLSIDLLRM